MKVPKLLTVFLLAFGFFFWWSQTLPVTDSVESNYTLTAKEMIEASDWLSPRIYGKVWFDKPVLFYWLLALAMHGMGYSELAVRFVPALAGALGVVFTYWFTAKLKGVRAGIVAAALLATSFQYFVISKLIITDMVLFLFNAGALALFYLGYSGADNTKNWYWGMYVCLGMAVLTKGPVGILLPGLIVVLFLLWRGQWGELRRMKLLSGLFLFGLVALPWYLMMYLQHGRNFLDTFFGVHNYLRATVSEHPRDNVFYYYFVLFFVYTLPWSGLAFGGVRDGLRQARQRCDLSLLLVIWIGVFMGFYTLMATKYLTYTFPILFPVMVLTASYIERCWQKNTGLSYWTILGPLVFWQAVLGICGYMFLNTDPLQWIIYLSGMVICLGLTLGGLLRSKIPKQSKLPLYGVVLTYLLFTVMVLPALAAEKSGKNLAQQLLPYTGYQIGAYEFYSTAAVYYSGQLITAIKPQNAIGDFRGKAFGWVAKYTMPMRTIEEFAVQPRVAKLVIVPASKQQEFLAEATGIKLKKIGRHEDRIFYRVNP